jgi:arabinogalactan endo-1,4-beta-galactosidase
MSRLILIIIFLIFLLKPCHTQCFLTGGDLSYVNSVLANGGVYKDKEGNPVDPYLLFAEQGANLVRIRLWHTPENNIDKCGNPISTNNLDDVVLAFQRAKAQGMKLKLAIHYGDYFNDPGWQKMPKAWEGLSHITLLDSIYSYTYSVMERLEAEGVIPDIVAIGNETTNGFITETGTTDGWSWPDDADKFNTGLTAIDDFNAAYSTHIKKALHFTQSTASWLAGLFKNHSITNYDIIGISFYPVWSDLNSLQDLADLIKQLKKDYNKEIMIFETGAPWTTANADGYANIINNYGNFDYPVSPEGQRSFLVDLANTVYNNGGSGIIYWEPGWISSDMCDLWGQGSSYENLSFFDFKNSNTALPAFDVFNFCNTLLPVVSDIESEGISIYPNPTTGDFELKGLDKPTEIQVKDYMGRIVRIIHYPNNRIDISDLPDGLYFLTLLLDNYVITMQLLKK